jgi:predicted HicB family RNase H-like nuclease
MSKQEETEAATTIKLRIAPEFKAEIEAAARDRHVSVSALVRLAMVDYLRSREESQKGEEVAA